MWTFNLNGHEFVWQAISVGPMGQAFLVLFLVLTVVGPERERLGRAVSAALVASLVFPGPLGLALFVLGLLLMAVNFVGAFRRG